MREDFGELRTIIIFFNIFIYILGNDILILDCDYQFGPSHHPPYTTGRSRWRAGGESARQPRRAGGLDGRCYGLLRTGSYRGGSRTPYLTSQKTPLGLG